MQMAEVLVIVCHSGEPSLVKAVVMSVMNLADGSRELLVKQLVSPPLN